MAAKSDEDNEIELLEKIEADGSELSEQGARSFRWFDLLMIAGRSR